ncbi:MAG TPA: succinate dehydrogenase cytochrome b subunit [Acidimicrobiia bacterium]|nr:succinate dehydrogenase cytochrome b subunit [Acidimicrobiia bacterium]
METQVDQPAARAPVVPRTRRRSRNWLVDLYASAVGKKYVMAITGIVLIGYVFAHMVGNLKVYMGAEDMNHYGEWLRTLATPAVPRTVGLWGMRIVLAASFVFHVHAAYGLTRINQAARAGGYLHARDYAAANFASRTMRWTGVIVGLFVIFHLMDLTWGNANPDFVRGLPYENLVASFERTPVAFAYIVANLALGLHLYHGTWSMFQSLGWNHPRFNHLRRWFAAGFALLITLGNVSFPIAVMAGIVE